MVFFRPFSVGTHPTTHYTKALSFCNMNKHQLHGSGQHTADCKHWQQDQTCDTRLLFVLNFITLRSWVSFGILIDRAVTPAGEQLNHQPNLATTKGQSNWDHPHSHTLIHTACYHCFGIPFTAPIHLATASTALNAHWAVESRASTPAEDEDSAGCEFQLQGLVTVDNHPPSALCSFRSSYTASQPPTMF